MKSTSSTMTNLKTEATVRGKEERSRAAALSIRTRRSTKERRLSLRRFLPKRRFPTSCSKSISSGIPM